MTDTRCFLARYDRYGGHFSEQEAIAIVEAQIRCVAKHWSSVCDEAALGVAERRFFWGRQFLNPYAFTGLAGQAATLAALAREVREVRESAG